MTRLTSGVATDAAHLPVPYEPVPREKVVTGTPFTRYVDLDDGSDRTVGVWEHTPGVSRDVEADEVDFATKHGRQLRRLRRLRGGVLRRRSAEYRRAESLKCDARCSKSRAWRPRKDRSDREGDEHGHRHDAAHGGDPF